MNPYDLDSELLPTGGDGFPELDVEECNVTAAYQTEDPSDGMDDSVLDTLDYMYSPEYYVDIGEEPTDLDFE